MVCPAEWRVLAYAGRGLPIEATRTGRSIIEIPDGGVLNSCKMFESLFCGPRNF